MDGLMAFPSTENLARARASVLRWSGRGGGGAVREVGLPSERTISGSLRLTRASRVAA